MDNMHLYHLLLGSGWPIAGASVLITLVLLVRQVQLRRASRIFEMVAENARDGVVLKNGFSQKISDRLRKRFRRFVTIQMWIL